MHATLGAPARGEAGQRAVPGPDAGDLGVLAAGMASRPVAALTSVRGKDRSGTDRSFHELSELADALAALLDLEADLRGID
jgi:hypothetical protein